MKKKRHSPKSLLSTEADNPVKLVHILIQIDAHLVVQIQLFRRPED